jgi:hypothetical protein
VESNSSGGDDHVSFPARRCDDSARLSVRLTVLGLQRKRHLRLYWAGAGDCGSLRGGQRHMPRRYDARALGKRSKPQLLLSEAGDLQKARNLRLERNATVLRWRVRGWRNAQSAQWAENDGLRHRELSLLLPLNPGD